MTTPAADRRPSLDLRTADGLKAWRLAHRLTQSQLGDLLEVGWQTVSRWETGTTTVPKPVELALLYLTDHLP